MPNHDIEDLIKDNYSIYKKIEMLCNYGAAELLMPHFFFRKSLLDVGFTARGIEALYNQYLVSYDALNYHITNFLTPSAIINFKSYARNNTEERALRVVSTFPLYPFIHPYGIWLPGGARAKKHIIPDLITVAQFEQISFYSEQIYVKLNNKTTLCEGIIVSHQADEKLIRTKPLFKGFIVPDEGKAFDVTILVRPRKEIV